MTREEHIYQLKQYLQGKSIRMCPASSLYWQEHWEEVIKALEQEPTNTIDYRRAFKIACDLLNGDILYGVDTDKIYELMMKKDEVVSSSSYEEYILNHLQDLDQGQYANEPTTKNDLGVDCISRDDVRDVMQELWGTSGELMDRLMALPSVTPQLSSELEKNSKKLEKDFGELDCIDRAELLKAMDTWDKFGYTETGCFVREPKGDYIPYVHYEDMVNCVKGMPSVTPQEPILDKLRAEIDKIYEREGNSVDCLNALDELKEFIDNYKAESEVEDGNDD